MRFENNQCSACGAPVDENGDWTGALPQYDEGSSGAAGDDEDDIEETCGSGDCPFASDRMSSAEHTAAHKFLAAAPNLGPNGARRAVHVQRGARERDAANLIERGIAPSAAMRDGAAVIERATRRVMADLGLDDYGVALKRALSEHRAIANAFERGTNRIGRK